MNGVIESSQLFSWRRNRLHIAPEGLVLESRPRWGGEGTLGGFAEYGEVSDARAEGLGRRGTLIVDFHNGQSSWNLPDVPLTEAQWAAQLIREHLSAVDRLRQPTFSQALPLEELHAQAEQLYAGGEHRIIDLVDFLLLQGIFHGASDVHFEPFRDYVRVRFRIHGTLHDVVRLSTRLLAPLMMRLKVVSKLTVFRDDVPQEGRIVAHAHGRSVDLRVSILPTIHGEKVTVRLFDPDRGLFDLEEIGFQPEMLKQFQSLLQASQGTLLLTGPSNSGKTTTLYAALRHLHETNHSLSSIVTVEDPVEYDLQVINQTQTNPGAGLTFATGLRTILRQDPEVVMIGEIRDQETAEIAIRAGLTGHLILSTVHARSAPGVFVRLLDIGVEPFLVASSVTGVLAQRLVRTVCPDCVQPDDPAPELRSQFGLNGTSADFRRGVGCPACHGSGFAGRTGIFELLPVTEALREQILQKVPVGRLEQQVQEAGIPTLAEDGVAKACAGLTTLDEVARVCSI